jgi:hypothetical protein
MRSLRDWACAAGVDAKVLAIDGRRVERRALRETNMVAMHRQSAFGMNRGEGGEEEVEER